MMIKGPVLFVVYYNYIVRVLTSISIYLITSKTKCFAQYLGHLQNLSQKANNPR